MTSPRHQALLEMAEKLAELHMIKGGPALTFPGCYKAGFAAALDLLLPVVEALEVYNDEKLSGQMTHYWAEKVFEDLDRKLKGDK
jgi:hypothetical protein